MNIQVIEAPNVVRVLSPYDRDFVARARDLGGKYDNPTGAWVFKLEAAPLVREACLYLYGSDGSPQETLDVQVTARVPIRVEADIFRLAGRPVAQAWDHKGARLSDGVLVMSGQVDLAGTVDEPRIQIPAGTVLAIKDMTALAVDNIDLDKWEVEVVPRDLDAEIEALEQRRRATADELFNLEERLNGLYGERRARLEAEQAAAEPEGEESPNMSM